MPVDQKHTNALGWLILGALAVGVVVWFAYGAIEKQRQRERLRRIAETQRLEAQREPRGIFDTSIFGEREPDQVYVSPYSRDDGSRVRGHFRTEADETTENNWTTRPNVNPYTGAPGYRDP